MIRLHFIVEGQTEETFVNHLLAQHLGHSTISSDVRCVETSRTRSRIYRGGIRSFQQLNRDIQRWMREDQHPDAYFTTMFDLYALPSDFPGYDEAKRAQTPFDRVNRLELALAHTIGHPRFIPYIQLYEFEALLLADPAKLDWEFIEHTEPIQSLISIAAGFESPELINDSPETAPSKRIIQLIPEYAGRKSSAGPIIAGKIGMATLRARCPHFHQWVERLESLSTEHLSL